MADFINGGDPINGGPPPPSNGGNGVTPQEPDTPGVPWSPAPPSMQVAGVPTVGGGEWSAVWVAGNVEAAAILEAQIFTGTYVPLLRRGYRSAILRAGSR